jgi:hypothetical protein
VEIQSSHQLLQQAAVVRQRVATSVDMERQFQVVQVQEQEQDRHQVRPALQVQAEKETRAAIAQALLQEQVAVVQARQEITQQQTQQLQAVTV